MQPPDSHHLSAAEGWLELGNCPEALAELDHIAAGEQGRLEVLAVRWSVLAQLKCWEDCVGIAAAMIERAPECVFGWIHRSYALHELKRTREARDLLRPAADRFSDDETIPYNLACYECQLGDFPAARGWLRRAMTLRKPVEVKVQALADIDLAPMWKEIQQMNVAAA